MTESKKIKVTSAKLNLRVRVSLAEEIAFGPGKAELLEAIIATGSISAAGKNMQMSYRRAWLLVDSMNRCFHTALVETAKGGKNGGGAQVTAYGEEILRRYREMEVAANAAVELHFKSFAPLLRREPLPPTSTTTTE